MTNPIDRFQAPTPATETTRNDKAQGHTQDQESSPQFRVLLDSLERLVRDQANAQPEPVDDAAESLQSALDKADNGFKEVMDLRKSLEEAFQRRMS